MAIQKKTTGVTARKTTSTRPAATRVATTKTTATKAAVASKTAAAAKVAAGAEQKGLKAKLEERKAEKAKPEKKTERERVEERREEVLAQGRKFKYPIQYAKHKLIIITIAVAVLAVVAVTVGGWLALYKGQTTDDTMYRITQALPLPVAKIDGEDVRYSDYLMIYRSSLTAAEQQSGKLGDDADAVALKNEYKRTALNSAEDYAYAQKLAREQGITVSGDEVTAEYDRHKKLGGTERSEEGFLKVLNDNFGMSKSEYRRMLELSILKSKVMAAIDATANETAAKVEQGLTEGRDLAEVAEELGDAVEYEETGGLVNILNVDGGRATEALKLEPGETSQKFVSSNGDGYYFVKLIEKNDTQVNYTSIKVKFTEFDKRVATIRENGGVTEYIEVKTTE